MLGDMSKNMLSKRKTATAKIYDKRRTTIVVTSAAAGQQNSLPWQRQPGPGNLNFEKFCRIAGANKRHNLEMKVDGFFGMPQPGSPAGS